MPHRGARPDEQDGAGGWQEGGGIAVVGFFLVDFCFFATFFQAADGGGGRGPMIVVFLCVSVSDFFLLFQGPWEVS